MSCGARADMVVVVRRGGRGPLRLGGARSTGSAESDADGTPYANAPAMAAGHKLPLDMVAPVAAVIGVRWTLSHPDLRKSSESALCPCTRPAG